MSDGTERWLPVVGFEGLYKVSDLGRVCSIDRYFRRRNGVMFTLHGRMLKLPPGSHGYKQVTLWRDGRHHVRTVHSVVAEAFIGAAPGGMEVRHGPGGALDNSAANLCYGTPTENAADKVRDGTVAQGSLNGHAILTEDAVRECRVRRATTGITYAALAAEFGMGRHGISLAVRGKRWGHVDGQ